MDHTTAAQGFSYPGIDPRLWVSLGTVDEDTPEARSVRFEDENGGPLPTGPLVTVTLQPSGVTVVCRVGSFIAGIGEGTWMPFSAKDEVLVVCPGGYENGCPVIVARLNQEIDEWPPTVAGQDAKKNNFGFWRLRVPFVVETAEAFLIRSAKTGSQVGIDGTGQVILNNGDKNHVFIGSDAISLSSGDEKTFLQLNFSEDRATIASGNARFELSAKGESIFQSPAGINIGTGGARGNGHAVTAEQVFCFVANVVAGLASTACFAPGSPLGAAWPSTAPGPLVALFQLVAPALVAPTPIGQSGAPGGNLAPLSGVLQTIKAGMLNPLPASDPTGLIPGFGRAGLML